MPGGSAHHQGSVYPLKAFAQHHQPEGRCGCSKMEKHEDGMKERRWVKLASDDYNANQLPPEWDQWLRKSRLQAPSDEDMAKYGLSPSEFCFQACMLR